MGAERPPSSTVEHHRERPPRTVDRHRSRPSSEACVSKEAKVIPKKIVDRYAHQSGVKDQLVAEREVVLTYALHAMLEANVLELLASREARAYEKSSSVPRAASRRISISPCVATTVRE